MYAIKTNGEIALPRGDTLLFTLRLKVDGEPARFPEGTVGVFGVYNGGRRRVLLARDFPVADGAVVVRLRNADTRDLAAGTYAWDLRIVTDPERGEDGSVRCDDDSDEVLSLFSGAGEMPAFVVTEVAADV